MGTSGAYVIGERVKTAGKANGSSIPSRNESVYLGSCKEGRSSGVLDDLRLLHYVRKPVVTIDQICCGSIVGIGRSRNGMVSL
jgi:hypothetical protein